jgi:hypothetical protein
VYNVSARIRYSSVSIEMGWTPGVRFLGGARDFSLLHSVQTGSRAHPVSYPVGTGALSSEVNRPGRETHHSPPSGAEVKNGGAIPPLPIRLHGVVLNYTGTTLPLPYNVSARCENSERTDHYPNGGRLHACRH